MFTSGLFCLLLCPQYCDTHKQTNCQVQGGLSEFRAFLALHFEPTAVEVYERNLFVFIFRFWAYLAIAINVTSYHKATNTTTKGSQFHAFFTSVSLPLPCPLSGRGLAHVHGRISKPISGMTFCGEAMLLSTEEPFVFPVPQPS